MKLLCIVPPEYTVTTFMYRNSPVGIYKIASKMLKEGHEVKMLNMYPMYRPRRFVRYDEHATYFKDVRVTELWTWKKCGNFEDEDLYRQFHRIGLPLSELTATLLQFQPDEIYVGNSFTFLWRGVYEVIAECKRVFPNVKVTLGGIYPTLCPEHAAKSGADKIMTRQEMDVQDSFMHIDTSLFGDNLPTRLYVGSSVGCPNNCEYCAVRLVEGCRKVDATVEDVIEELQKYYALGIKKFVFLDANVLMGWDNHFKKILEKIIEAKMRVTLYSYGGVEARLVTEEKAELMLKAGFENLNIPIESASESILKEWKRKNFVPEWLNAVKIAKKCFTKPIKSYMIIGAPNQTIKDCQETVDFIETNGVEALTLPFTPIPGTSYYEKYKEMDLEDLNPALYPCAHPKMKVRDLEAMFCKSRKAKDVHLYTLEERQAGASRRVFESNGPQFHED